ncbi:aldehyde dehydrogenase family protein [Kribbella sp. NBC_01505]|uniref:aldehyde dehydrogenase family protein n=1 Tax=Kribbella sp. NBC_01505 TaxID=2903580 RepID=UPI00386BF37C
MTSPFTMTIGGTAVDGNAFFPVVNPANGAVVADAPNCSPQQLDAAVATARNALPAWSARPVAERQKVLIAMADAVDANTEVLAGLITAEQGKPIDVARTEVFGLGYWLRETAALELPETVNQDDTERLSITRRVPLGVVAAITPWNYPLGQASFKVGPAMLAGNTVVLKPSPAAPLANLKLGEILRDVVPAGVLNVISGDDSLGAQVTAHPGFDKISFTGSTRTGKLVMAAAAQSLSRITLELGGNDPAIVLPDVDIEETAEKLFWAAFSNSGQICLAAKRIYIHADIYDELAGKLTTYARSVEVGDPTEEGVQLGPVSNRRQYDTVVGLLEDCERNGYSFLTGGLPDASSGFFIQPTLVDNPPEDSRIVQEEQFGPVLPLLRYDDLDDAIARANASQYGLGASVWSADPDVGFAVAQRIQSGTVWVNEIMHLSPLVGFGGLKQSGIGTESGLAGLLEFTESQTLTVKRSA